jgi:hypothetical protein
LAHYLIVKDLKGLLRQIAPVGKMRKLLVSPFLVNAYQAINR